MGISRRINAVPRGFKLGEHWVWIAHPKIQQVSNTELDGMRWAGGVMAMFRPTRIEKVMTESQERALTDDDRDDLANKGVTPFVVPDNDRDHQGTVYDREEELI